MIRRLLRKTSLMLVMAMLLSMVVPIVSHAMNVMYFMYRPTTDELTGYVYTNDPNSVSVSYNNGTETEVTYDLIHSNLLYDDNNTPYSSINYKFLVDDMDQAPSNLSVNLEGTTYNLMGHEYSSYPGHYSYFSSASANLGSYRMTGQHLFSTVTAATYLPSGSDIVRFTPSQISSANVIRISLPYNNDTNVEFNGDAMDFMIRDFEIIDQTVSSAVYYNGYSHSSGGQLTFILNTSLVQDHEYLVRLSSTSSGDEIMLPTDGTYTASVAVGNWVGTYPSGYYDQDNIIYFRNMTIGTAVDVVDPVDENPVYTPPIGNAPDTPDTPDTPDAPEEDHMIVNETSLRNGSQDKVAIDIAGGKKQVMLPANAADIIGDRKLELKNDSLIVQIPAEVLKKLQSLITSDQLASSQISFKFETLNDEQTLGLMNEATGKSTAGLKTAGDVYEFTLSMVNSNGSEVTLAQFDEAITLRLKVNAGANKGLLGVYYIADDGELEYVGGELIDGEMIVDVNHFSTYAVLEYDKTFDDVTSNYWAYNVIKELSAKHIVSGVSHSEFAPQERMTRAEFAALITRTLGLAATQPSSFSDVNRDMVHADSIAAASEAEIIHGRSASKFAPNDQITREEMVTMIIRAYEYKSNKRIVVQAEAIYEDRELASEWAIPYIDAATAIGIVQGHDQATFAPKQLMTRAEGAQVIYRLLMSE